jgi:hypothetical protein
LRFGQEIDEFSPSLKAIYRTAEILMRSLVDMMANAARSSTSRHR